MSNDKLQGELMPCPFCGGAGEYHHDNEYVTCNDCSYDLPTGIWNTRAAIASDAEPSGAFYRSLSGVKAHFFGPIKKETYSNKDITELRPFWFEPPTANQIAAAALRKAGEIPHTLIRTLGNTQDKVDVLAKARDEILALIPTEVTEQRDVKDAARYRVIRAQGNFSKPTMQGGRAAVMIGNWDEDLDKAIDDIASAKQEGE